MAENKQADEALKDFRSAPDRGARNRSPRIAEPPGRRDAAKGYSCRRRRHCHNAGLGARDNTLATVIPCKVWSAIERDKPISAHFDFTTALLTCEEKAPFFHVSSENAVAFIQFRSGLSDLEQGAKRRQTPLQTQKRLIIIL